MMKILISADMEGISGVTNWDQVEPGRPEYQRFRRIMTGDVNAAVEGAFAGGAEEVLVVDGHWDGSNLLLEELDLRVKLNTGLATSPYSMMQGLDEGVNGVIFVGYHARAGTEKAVLDHTWSRKLANLWLNDELLGEIGLNAALAGYFGVPLIMITGDQAACAEAAGLIGPVESAVVKQAHGRYSAECLSLSASQTLIKETARRALGRLKKGAVPDPYILDTPLEVTVEFISSEMADRAMRVPGAVRDGNHVAVSAADMAAAYTAFRALADVGTLGAD